MSVDVVSPSLRGGRDQSTERTSCGSLPSGQVEELPEKARRSTRVVGAQLPDRQGRDSALVLGDQRDRLGERTIEVAPVQVRVVANRG